MPGKYIFITGAKLGSMAQYEETTLNISDDTQIEQSVALFVNSLSAICMIHRIKIIGAKSVIIDASES